MSPTDSELKARLYQPEDRLTERKPAGVNAASICRTLVAFANSVPDRQFAVLFLGMHNDGRIQRVPESAIDAIQKKVVEIAEHDCFPPIPCTCRVLADKGHRIVAVIVAPSKDRPHFTGHAYVRRGTESVKATRQLFDELIASRHDKVRRILAEKDNSVSVYRPAKPESAPASQLPFPPRNQRDYRVEYCDAFYVRLVDSCGVIEVFPLESVTVSFDPAKNRMLVLIDGKH